MGQSQALEYEPQEQTYGIRIGFSGICSEIATAEFKRLESHPLYVPHAYYFDDAEPWTKDEWERPITKETATKIVNDFKEGKDRCSALLVHCERGQSRSPAVAMSLNHIFNLGYSNKELAQKYPLFNLHVAQTLYTVAEEMGLYDSRVCEEQT